MSYIEQQRKRAIELRETIFRDPGQGNFMGEKRSFVLANPALNLWDGIREDAIAYFKRNNIGWWKSGEGPAGHLLSSQIACVNHLYPLRQREELANAILNSSGIKFKRALMVDDGFVEFEKVGAEKLGKEKSLTRGANSTSIDAMMIGETNEGQKILILIEWKYTESYHPRSLLFSERGTSRLEIYKDLLLSPDSPISTTHFEDLFYEPFYQLMRQTLLAWSMVQRNEYGCNDWIHLHVIPHSNTELRETVTSKGLKGKSLEEAWKNTLVHPEKYIIIDPAKLFSPLEGIIDTRSHLNYLAQRYWNG